MKDSHSSSSQSQGGLSSSRPPGSWPPSSKKGASSPGRTSPKSGVLPTSQDSTLSSTLNSKKAGLALGLSDDQHKREEFRTYKALALGRELKSERQRRHLAASGKSRVIGDGSVSRPFLVVPEARYREIWRAHQILLLQEARAQKLEVALDVFMEHSRSRLERQVYASLSEEARRQALQKTANSVLGRGLTSEEKQRFAESAALGDLQKSTLSAAQDRETKAIESPGDQRPRTHLDRSLHQILGQVEARQIHNPAHYQTVWTNVVGPDAAAQSRLERIDEAAQVAYFRCTNSVLSMDLQRRPQLAQKLSAALGKTVKKLKSTF